MENWIKCSERMPRRSSYGGRECCIVRIKYLDNNQMVQECNNYDWFDELKDQWERHERDEVTHWMYLQDIKGPSGE